MTALQQAHLLIHQFLTARIQPLVAHLIIATILCMLLLGIAAFVRDPRARRGILLMSFLVFLAPTPELIAHRASVLLLPGLPSPSLALGGAGLVEARGLTFDLTCTLAAIWFGMTSLLLVRLLLRLIAGAASGEPLDAAIRERLDLTDEPPIRISSNAAGPCVAGCFRSVIVLPGALMQSLPPEELKAVLLHEAAHVRQRDNLWRMAGAITTSLFWFHPLTWWSVLRFRGSCEIACDSEVLASGIPLQTYLRSLHRMTQSPEGELEPAFAGEDLKGRIEIMKHPIPRWSNAAIRFALIALVLLSLGGSVTLRAMIGSDSTANRAEPASEAPYRFENEVIRRSDGTIEADFLVLDVGTGEILSMPRFLGPAGSPMKSTSTVDGPDQPTRRVQVLLSPGSSPTRMVATLDVNDPDDGTFHHQYDVLVKAAATPSAHIDLKLKDAALSDVLNTFASVLGVDVIAPREVDSQKVSVTLEDIPWDQALDQVLAGRHLAWRKVGGLLVIMKAD